MSVNKIESAYNLGAMLEEAGIIPPMCGDVIIEIPVGGAVRIHTAIFADDRLTKVLAAFCESAKVVEEEKTSTTEHIKK